MAAYGQTQYSPALQPAGPYTPYTHHTQGYSMTSYSEWHFTPALNSAHHSWPDSWSCLFLSPDQILKQKMAWVIHQDRAVCWDTRPTSAALHPLRRSTVTPHTVSATTASKRATRSFHVMKQPFLHGILELGMSNKPSNEVKSSHHYLYSAFYNADCVKAALQY